MGKPFHSELNQLSETIQWVSDEVLPHMKPLWLDRSIPAYCIGSGGSQSAADFLARLIRSRDGFAWATTPLEYLNLGGSLAHANVFLVSASGKNKDIVAAARRAVNNEAELIGVMTARVGSPLAKEVLEYSTGAVMELALPSGKDGFLATNSLIAMMLGLLGISAGDKSSIPIAQLKQTAAEIADASAARELRHSEPEVIIIHAGWGGSAALDLESKLSEAALAPAMICDLRNFGHGRHHWLAKRSSKTLVVTVEDRRYEGLFTKTLNLFPPDVQVIRLKSALSGPASAIDLTLRVFGLVRDIGDNLGVDPGRPGVPDFGRRIYHLSPGSKLAAVPSDTDQAAIRRNRDLPSRSQGLARELNEAAAVFRSRIAKVDIRAVVFDYDGTLVDTRRRFEPIDQNLSQELLRLVSSGIRMGVATGRGKSVREPLRNALPKELWSRILVGYYNATQVIPLDVDCLPDTEATPEDGLVTLKTWLETDPWLSAVGASLELRPNQLSVSGSGCSNFKLWLHISRLLADHDEERFKCLSSSHSVDILPKELSKLVLVESTAKAAGCETRNVLCIGDSGLWPGNDCELLSHFPSLSSGKAPNILTSGWNLAPSGVLESRATLYYLECLKGSDVTRLVLEK